MMFVARFVLLSALVGITIAKLEITQKLATKQENEKFFVICKDKDTGAKVSWRGPKNRALGEKTNPQALVTMHGVQLIFNPARKGDEGIYICRTDFDSVEFVLEVADSQNLEDPVRIVTTPSENPDYTKYYKQKYFSYTPVTNRSTTIAPSSAPASIKFVDTPTVVTGKEGTDIILKCEAQDATIEWLVNGDPPVDENKFKLMGDGLLIKNASAEDSVHEYICRAKSTDAGTFEDRQITVNINHAPRLKYEREEIVYGYTGGKINLTCEVEANPPPTFRWKKEDRYKIIVKEVYGPSPTVSVLMLNLQDSRDFGEYTCEAKNPLGKLEVRYSVLNGTKPNAPIYMELVKADLDTLVLRIEEPETTEFENITGMEPTGIRIDYKSDEESIWNTQSFPITQDKTYAVTNLTENTTYYVRSATENRAGFSDFTNITEYQTSSAHFFPVALPSLYTIIGAYYLVSG